MNNSLLICAASAFVFAASPARAETPTDDSAVSEGVFAVPGACVWAQQRTESGLGAAFIAETAGAVVRSFVAALQRAAAGRTHVSTATLIIDPQRHECIQFVRGDLSVTARQEDTLAALRAMLGDAATQDQARLLHTNGVRLSSPPNLIIEVRLHTIRESAAGERLVVLEPSFIGYREPAFEQSWRVWGDDERTFAFQLQLAEAPEAPAAIASGGHLQLGTREPSNERLHIDMRQAASPGSSLAFQIEAGELYNARVSVSESSSESAFLTFWANVIAAEPVQTAATGAVQDALTPAPRVSQATAYGDYATKRSALGTAVNSCPVEVNEAARQWVMTERANLVQAIDAYARAAADARVNMAEFPSLAPEAGTAAIVTWCGQARGFLESH